MEELNRDLEFDDLEFDDLEFDDGDIEFDDGIDFDDTDFEDDTTEEFDNDTGELEGLDDIEFDDDIIDDGVSNDGVVVDGIEHEEESDEFEVMVDDTGFISDTGDIVVMDKEDSQDSFKLIYVDIEDIAIVKRIRKRGSVEALVRSIRSTGLLQPVTVAPTATEGLYVLLDGYRRILACARAGKRDIPCIVNNKVNTPEIPVLEALYNHNTKYNVREMVDYIDYLEKEKGIMSASMIEYLLQLNSGDYTKLKDIINDDDEEIVSKLYEGAYTIGEAFKKLEQRRRKESAAEKEQREADKVYGDEEESGVEAIAGSGEEADDGAALSDEEIKSLAISPSEIDDGIDDTSLEDMIEEGESIEGYEPNKQDYRDRQRLDPALRKSVLARDENTCQVCKDISGQEYLEVLDIHHIIEVYLGGDDSIENLITTCTVCHKLIHLYARGELYMRPLDEMSEREKVKFKRILKLGNIIRQGLTLKGMKREELKKVDKAETIGRRLKGSSDQVAT